MVQARLLSSGCLCRAWHEGRAPCCLPPGRAERSARGQPGYGDVTVSTVRAVAVPSALLATTMMG